MKTIDRELLDETVRRAVYRKLCKIAQVMRVHDILHKNRDTAVRRIVAALQPEGIYLYGSHAYGQPHEDSDVDLLVIVGDSALPPHKRAVVAYRALRGLFVPAEVRVVTRAEFERRAQWHSSVERIVREKEKVLYGSGP